MQRELLSPPHHWSSSLWRCPQLAAIARTMRTSHHAALHPKETVSASIRSSVPSSKPIDGAKSRFVSFLPTLRARHPTKQQLLLVSKRRRVHLFLPPGSKPSSARSLSCNVDLLGFSPLELSVASSKRLTRYMCSTKTPAILGAFQFRYSVAYLSLFFRLHSLQNDFSGLRAENNGAAELPVLAGARSFVRLVAGSPSRAGNYRGHDQCHSKSTPSLHCS